MLSILSNKIKINCKIIFRKHSFVSTHNIEKKPDLKGKLRLHVMLVKTKRHLQLFEKGLLR